MENINLIVARNLVKFRTKAGFTQYELAQQLNYSDKSISKWERGESLPDLSVLIDICKIYNITLNDLTAENLLTTPISHKTEKKSHLLVAILSAGLVWLVASVCFAILYIINATRNISWFSFIYAIPLSSIVLLVFSAIWGKRWLNGLLTSFVLWGIILAICLSIIVKDIWVICIIGAIFQVLIILWFLFRKVYSENMKVKSFLNKFLSKNKNRVQNKEKEELIK